MTLLDNLFLVIMIFVCYVQWCGSRKVFFLNRFVFVAIILVSAKLVFFSTFVSILFLRLIGF